MSTNGGSAAPPCGRNSRNAIWGGGALPPHTWGPPSLAIIDPGLGSIIDSPAVECWLPAGRRCLWCVGVFFCGFLRIFFSGTLWGRKVRRSRPAAARRPMVSHASPLRRRDRARACHAGGGGGGGEGGGWGAPMPEGWRRGGPRAPGRGRARAAPLHGRRGARRIGTRRADDRNARQKKKKRCGAQQPRAGAPPVARVRPGKHPPQLAMRGASWRTPSGRGFLARFEAHVAPTTGWRRHAWCRLPWRDVDVEGFGFRRMRSEFKKKAFISITMVICTRKWKAPNSRTLVGK